MSQFFPLADRRHRFCGQIESGRLFAPYLPYGGDAHRFGLFFYVRAADRKRAVHFNVGAAEGFSVQKRAVFRVLARRVLRIPHVVFPHEPYGDGREKRLADADVRRAFRAEGKTVFVLAVKKAEQVAFLYFQYDLFHAADSRIECIYYSIKRAAAQSLSAFLCGRSSLRAAARFSAFSDKTARRFAGRSEQKNRARTFRSGADMNFVYSPRKGRRATMRAFLIAFESSL